MRSSGVHHVDLVVSSVERSLPFYRDLLGPLGYHRVSRGRGRAGRDDLVLRRAGQLDRDPAGAGSRTIQRRRIDRYEVGLHHLALEAGSRAVVDERHAWLVGAGATIETPPREYAYSPGYYAVFFYDPDGIKLEIVHVPGLAA